MGDQNGWINRAVANPLESEAHVFGVATAGSHDMGTAVVDVVEVQRRGKVGVCGASEKVKAATSGE